MRPAYLCIIILSICSYVQALDVRVLLAEFLVNESPVVQLRSAGGFVVSRGDKTDVHEINQDVLSITFAKGHVLLDGRPLAVSQFIIHPKNENDGLGLADHVYDGDFMVSVWRDKLFIVNMLDLEAYLCSVLRWEGWPTWHEEANRAFAVVCRTYAAHKVFLARKRIKKKALGLLFDIHASNTHQTYAGRHKQRHWKQVVEETSGMILAYQGEPIAAMYDMSCGGIVPSSLAGIDFAKYPYLKRDYPCLACRDWPHYAWKKEISVGEFEQRLQVRLRTGVSDARVFSLKHDAAGTLCQLSVKTRRGAHVISGKQFYSLFKKEAKSLYCAIEKKGKSIIVEGKGYGHLLGYCQWGAAYMAKEQGVKYKELLSFFYPEAQLARLKKRGEVSAGI
ncbi:MAG: SpoIID/LytB domain protein [candidate division TM6 bacterium GW2011_GWF2_43_17]|nr:MAG: SpoIID/LytB domain protein [candidate division TM6 bacterium GW2011_GWF2_43_17]